MTPKEFKNAGQVLFPGKSWIVDLSRALNVNRLTIRRWADGEYPVPPEKQQLIFDLVCLHLRALKKLVNEQKGRLK